MKKLSSSFINKMQSTFWSTVKLPTGLPMEGIVRFRSKFQPKATESTSCSIEALSRPSGVRSGILRHEAKSRIRAVCLDTPNKLFRSTSYTLIHLITSFTSYIDDFFGWDFETSMAFVKCFTKGLFVIASCWTDFEKVAITDLCNFIVDGASCLFL